MNLGGWAGSVAVVVVLAGPAAHARAQQADAGQIQALYRQGERALAEQRYADAEQAYERLRELQPGLADVPKANPWCRDSFNCFLSPITSALVVGTIVER